MTNYETKESRRHKQYYEKYEAQYALYLNGELDIPGAEEMNDLELAAALCPEYARIWAQELSTKYGSLLSKG